MTRVQRIEEALRLLGIARNDLKLAKCPQALAYVRRAMKSVEGARRHAMRMESEVACGVKALTEPMIRPMPTDNPMYEMGYRWEVHYPDGGYGGAEFAEQATKLAKHWMRQQGKAVAS